ncbi:hypothetical protein [Clostridium hydrogenum]|nr:hypothetical protein [Clostridium hydrogenum]
MNKQGAANMEDMSILEFLYIVFIISAAISFFFILLPEYIINLFKNKK